MTKKAIIITGIKNETDINRQSVSRLTCTTRAINVASKFALVSRVYSFTQHLKQNTHQVNQFHLFILVYTIYVSYTNYTNTWVLLHLPTLYQLTSCCTCPHISNDMHQTIHQITSTVDPQLSEPCLSELSLIRTPIFGNYNDIHWNFAVH